MHDVLLRPALDQAALLRAGAVSCEALTAACLARIAARNDGLHAFVQVAPARALAAARALDRERRRHPDAPRGPLWGLPTGIKDLHLTRGFFMRGGSRAFRYAWSPVDDVTSATVRRAGLVILGKLATSELGILPVIETELDPATANPWDRERTAGGSSGGSAAAIAAGLIPLAAGSDGGGSIRIPASFCGLVGLKPTRGLVPNPHSTFERLGLSVIGPLARCVDDAAALLDLLTGRVQGAASFLAAARRAPAALRIRFTTENPVIATEAPVVAAVARITQVLAALGHAVDEGASLPGRIDEFVPMFQFLAARAPVPAERFLQPTTLWLRAAGRSVTAAQAHRARDLFTARAEACLAGADVWVSPTVAVSPPRLYATAGMAEAQAFERHAVLGAYTAALNASGMPAITVPVRVPGHRWPVGVQLAGRQGDDAQLLALARTVLEALGTPLVAPAPVVEVPERARDADRAPSTQTAAPR